MKVSKLEVYQIETLGTLDGPGVRTVIFLQGCPMKCSYCHNPDSWLKNKGTYYDIDELIKLVDQYKCYYGQKGGVTISGGEPLMQSQVLLQFIRKLKEDNIHVALDTSGALFTSDTKSVIDLVDLVILDIKADNDASSLQLTDHGMDNPIKNLQYIQSISKPYWIRHVVLPGYDVKHDINKMTIHPNREKLEFLTYHSLGVEKWEPWQEKYRKEY